MGVVDGLIVGLIIVAFGVTLYGSALIIVEHFWIGVLLLLFLTPIFFVWAFFRGLIGKHG